MANRRKTKEYSVSAAAVKKALRGKFNPKISLIIVVLVAIASFLILKFFSAEPGLKVSPVSGELEVHVLDVGNADAVLIREGSFNMLIDAGEKGDRDKIISYIKRLGIKRLDYVLATHPDADHIGSMDFVVNEFEIGKFYMPVLSDDLTPTGKTYLDLLDALEEKNVDSYKAEKGISFNLEETKIEFLAPDYSGNAVNSSNNYSIVCKLSFGDNRFLFMGDAEKEVEALLLDSYNASDLKADFLKVGHHGSKTSSTQKFIETVLPRYSVITCGQNNSYNHPHKNVLSVLKSVNSEIYRSDLNGDIVAVSDGKSIKINKAS